MEQYLKDIQSSQDETMVSTQDDSINGIQIDENRIREAKEVADLLKNMDKLVTPGSKWHIVNMKWIESWQKYTYFDYLSNDP